MILRSVELFGAVSKRNAPTLKGGRAFVAGSVATCIRGEMSSNDIHYYDKSSKYICIAYKKVFTTFVVRYSLP